MWACGACGRTFANRNQVHACAPLGDLDRHFAEVPPLVRATFDRVLEVVRSLGPVDVLPEKTRIALHVRMSFAAFMPRRNWLTGHLVLARYLDSPRFTRIETLSPRNVVHAFRLTSPADVDTEFAAWLTESYRGGHPGTPAPLNRAHQVWRSLHPPDAARQIGLLVKRRPGNYQQSGQNHARPGTGGYPQQGRFTMAVMVLEWSGGNRYA